MHLVFPLLCTISAAAAADLTGMWTGELTHPGGERIGAAHLVLKQEGSKLSGTGGPSADEQYPVLNGSVSDGGEVKFDLGHQDSTMKFSLQWSGDEIKGGVTRQRDGQTQHARLSVRRVAAQSANQMPVNLQTRLAALDKELFDAYNACDMAKMGALFDDKDIEFYHDQGGLLASLPAILEATKKNVCGKVRRELVSAEVYPVPGYGAIQTGVHKFYNRSSGKEEGGEAVKFLHIWHEGQNDVWKLTRVVSYAH